LAGCMQKTASNAIYRDSLHGSESFMCGCCLILINSRQLGE
jgi:hypothetical protein